jgi:uncharacterized membrane protein
VALAVTTYEWAKALHVLAAVVWVGGAAVVQVLALFALRSKLPGRKAEFAREAEWVGMKIFLPSTLLLIALGFYLVHEGHWGYHLWVILALVGFGLSFVTGLFFLGPESGRIAKAIDAQGPDSHEVELRIKRILVVSRIEVAILIFLVFDMVLKPGQ